MCRGYSVLYHLMALDFTWIVLALSVNIPYLKTMYSVDFILIQHTINDIEATQVIFCYKNASTVTVAVFTFSVKSWSNEV